MLHAVSGPSVRLEEVAGEAVLLVPWMAEPLSGNGKVPEGYLWDQLALS